VVVGLGDTGVLTAARLARRFDVVGISPKPGLVSGQELGPRLAQTAWWSRYYRIGFDRLKKLDGVRTVHGEVRQVAPERQEVHLVTASGQEVVESFDALVIASGVSNGFWRRGVVQDPASVDADVAGVAESISEAGALAVVGGGATGVSVAYNVARHHPGKAVHLFHSGAEVLPSYHPRVRQRIASELERVGVHRHPEHRAQLPADGAPTALTSGPIAWSTGQEPFSADVALWAVGRVTPHTSFLPAEMLDDQGFVRVDEHLRVPGYLGVFAVGDVAATDPNRSSARNWGFKVVVKNVMAFARGRDKSLKVFEAPQHRWGSVLGMQPDGIIIFSPTGRAFRVPRWLAQPLFFDAITMGVIYGGVRRP